MQSKEESTNPLINFSPEMGSLLIWISDVATAIRLNSSYAYCDRQRYSDEKPEKLTQMAHDVMWLSDPLHTLFQLGDALQSGSPHKIIDGCNGLLKQFRFYEKDDPYYKSNPKDRFERYNKLFKLEEAMQIFTNIKHKAQSIVNV